MRRRGSQTSIGPALSKLLGRLDRKAGGRFAQVEAAEVWREIAGPSAVSHTTGFFIRDGEAVVYVDSGVWATELSALSNHYREAINARTGQETVKTMRFIVSRKVAAEHRFTALEKEADEALDRDKVESIPLTASEMAHVQASVATIEDEELREAALRATVADLEWKKGIAERNSREAARESL